MENTHSFNVYIRNNWEFTSIIQNADEFDVYIKNKHYFSSYMQITPSDTPENLYWFIDIHNYYPMLVEEILLGLNLTLDIVIPKVLQSISDSGINIQIDPNLSTEFIIPPPTIEAMIAFLVSIGISVDVPFDMSTIISQGILLENTIDVRSILIEASITGCRYYMLDYFDADLLSDWDSILLSAMDCVSI